MKKKGLLAIVLMIMLVSAAGWFFVIYAGNRGDNNSSLNIYFNPKMRRFVEILDIVNESYYRDINEDELIESAIEGMLKKLDPHSIYIFENNDLQNFNMTTTGEFGGIGFRVGIRDEQVTVIAPIENTPASRKGIKAGDIILKIDTISTEGMDIDQAVSLMRGEPGTEVSLIVDRLGNEIKFDIVREIINIKSIPYYGMISDSIGYIKVVQFSENLDSEFRTAMDELFIDKKAKKIILDLRNNPGGLLNEAITMSDYFLPRGVNIVSTKSRNNSMEMSFKAQKPVYQGFFPLIVLVDNGSASASEIVAGAVQDWDRGVILGDTTYGKGSVQSVYDFSKYSQGEEGILKFTTARYFTPSGRSIDRELIKYEHADADTNIYRSLGGFDRILPGSGGIIPDYIYQERYLSDIEIDLIRKQLFFGFAVEYLSEHKMNNDMVINFPQSVFDDFMQYLSENGIDIEALQTDSLAADYTRKQIQYEFARQIGGDELFYTVYLNNDNLVSKAVNMLKETENSEALIEMVSDKAE